MSPLHLDRLTLSNFRSHRRAALDLGPRPVALFGPNGAGKTNVLEAVSLFSPGRGLRRASAQDMARRPDAPGWKVTGLLTAPDGLHEIAFASEAGAPRQLRVDDKTAPQTALGELARILWLVPPMDRLWIEGAEGRRRFLDRMTLGFFPAHAEATLDYEKAMRDRNRLLKDQVRDPGWYRALEAQMARAGAILTANRQAALARIETAQQGAETAFPAAALDLVALEGEHFADPEPLAEALAEGRGRDLMAGRTLLGPHRADLAAIYSAKGMPAAECSTGEQKALLVSLVLANARAISADFGAAPILLLDEVAAHLDSGRRAALFDEIVALGTQAWLTGTGPDSFAELGDRAQRLAVTETGGASEVTPA